MGKNQNHVNHQVFQVFFFKHQVFHCKTPGFPGFSWFRHRFGDRLGLLLQCFGRPLGTLLVPLGSLGRSSGPSCAPWGLQGRLFSVSGHASEGFLCFCEIALPPRQNLRFCSARGAFGAVSPSMGRPWAHMCWFVACSWLLFGSLRRSLAVPW